MGKLSELINKETQIKNETRRMTVIIRKLSLSFIVLSLFNLFLAIFFIHSVPALILWAGVIAADAFTLYLSYRYFCRTEIYMDFSVQHAVRMGGRLSVFSNSSDDSLFIRRGGI